MSRLLTALFLAATLLLSGCASARYRMQSRYRYPPPKSFYDKAAAPAAATAPATSSAPAAAAKPAPAAARPVASPAPVRSDPAVAAAPVVRTQPAAAPAPRVEPVFQAPPPTPAPASAVRATEDAAFVYRLKPGDPIIVYLRGIPGVQSGEQMIENLVDENGNIELPFINRVQVGGCTATEAQDIIRRAYVDQKIYRQLTVNVVIAARYYYIRGEVRQPGRYPIIGNVTLLQAVAAAGGYTEFANRRKGEVLRGEKKIPVDMQAIERSPDMDRAVEPGDVIIVHRSFF